MPELPEVETVRTILSKSVVNRTISDVKVFYNRIVQSDFDSFITDIKGQKILSVNRKGKFLVFDLSTKYLIVHLRMEGKFFHLTDLEANIDKHTSLYFTLDDNTYLFFKDTRKFGVMYLQDKENAYNNKPLSEVGPEPFEIADMDYLYHAFRRTEKPIKEALLDQKIMCGLGNIYVDETCFMSHINPFMKAKEITKEDSKKLILSARAILAKAIESGGSTIRSYHPSEGITGMFQNLLNVYGREGKKCPICNSIIKKRFVGGRGTSFCPKCQHVPYSIGLTGEIAAGKSTVLQFFKECGAAVFSSDEEVAKLYQSKSFINLVTTRFPEVITDGRIDKSKIIEEFTKSKKFKSAFERFVWSNVKDQLNTFLIKNYDVVTVAEIPLLFDAHYEHLFSFLVGVEANRDIKESYLIQRDGSLNNEKFAKTNSYNLHRHKLDYIIENNSDLESLRIRVKDIYNTIINS